MSTLSTSLAIAAITLAGAVATTAARASEATQFVDPPGTSTRSDVKEELARSKLDRSVTYYGEATVFVDPLPTASRAQVLAELEIWKRSGLAELERGDAPDYFSDRHRRAERRYAALRASPQFAELVQSIARERGESVGTTASHGAAMVR